MRIKEYDVSEGRIPNEMIRKWFEKAGYGHGINVSRTNVSGALTVEISNIKASMMFNSRSNLIYCWDEEGNITTPENEAEIMEDLFNSQWRDPIVELPEIDMKVVCKFGWDGITSEISASTYQSRHTHGEDDLGYSTDMGDWLDEDEIIVWLPAENVIM